jgi:hypothetical protein
MSEPDAPRRDPEGIADGVPGVARNWRDRRREKIIDEIERNRRGEYKVPTWVLTIALVVIVGAWVALIAFA